jgi:hypothetical protein
MKDLFNLCIFDLGSPLPEGVVAVLIEVAAAEGAAGVFLMPIGTPLLDGVDNAIDPNTLVDLGGTGAAVLDDVRAIEPNTPPAAELAAAPPLGLEVIELKAEEGFATFNGAVFCDPMLANFLTI